MRFSTKIVKEVDDSVVIMRDAGFESLCNATTITDVPCLSYAVNERFIGLACKKANITTIIISPSFKDCPELMESGKGVIVAEDPKCVFYKLHNHLIRTNNVDYIGEKKKNIIGDNCHIHGSAVIADEDVMIGNNVTIQENVIIRTGVEIGDDVNIMPGTIIGYDACLSSKDDNGNLMPLMSAGKVKIGKNVQIGAYPVVCRGLFPYEVTTIGDYSKVGAFVDISHNDHIGKNVVILDQSQVCGNTVVEDEVHISPRSIISNRLRVEEKADVAIGSVVVNNIKRSSRVAGNYAIDNEKFLLWHKNKLKVGKLNRK